MPSYLCVGRLLTETEMLRSLKVGEEFGNFLVNMFIVCVCELIATDISEYKVKSQRNRVFLATLCTLCCVYGKKSWHLPQMESVLISLSVLKQQFHQFTMHKLRIYRILTV